MPKVTSWYNQTMLSSWCRETFNGNLIINGTYHESATLAPRLQQFDYLSDRGGSNDMAALAATNTPYAPNPNFGFKTNRVNWNMPYGGCWYYLSGYNKLATQVQDSVVNSREYYLALGKSDLNTWTGISPGWGYVTATGNSGSHSHATQVYDDRSEVAEFVVTQTISQGTPGGFIGVNPTTGVLWRWSSMPHVTAAGTVGGTGATNMFNFIPNQTTVGAYRPLKGDTIFAHNNSTSTVQGGTSLATRITQPITFSSNIVWFAEHTLSATVGTGNVNVNNVFFIKKMSYANAAPGTEMTVTSHPQWMYGLKFPTQSFNDTDTTASFIYPLFNRTTANTFPSFGNLSLLRVDINKTNSTETTSLMTVNNSPGQRIYNLMGINTTVPAGVFNDVFWKYHSAFRCWIVNGPSGTNYLMMSFENTGYSFASYNNNSLATQPSSVFAPGLLNANGSGFDRKDCFKIWAFVLDSEYTTATYQAETDMSAYLPRWMFPLTTNNMVQYVSCMDSAVVDRVFRFDEDSRTWNLVATMPYRADSIGVDANDRVWVSTAYGQHPTTGHGLTTLYLESNVLPQTVSITPFATSYTYSGQDISTNVSVATTNIFGNLVVANVLVSLSGGMTFTDGTTSRNIETSTGTAVTANTIVVSAAPITISGTITGYI